MQINNIHSTPQTKQSFGSLSATQKTIQYIYKDVCKNNPQMIDTFKQTFKYIEKQQADNKLCDLVLFKGENLFTGDSCPTISILPKGGSAITQLYTHQDQYSLMGETESTIQMLNDGNHIATNFKTEILDALD